METEIERLRALIGKETSLVWSYIHSQSKEIDKLEKRLRIVEEGLKHETQKD